MSNPFDLTGQVALVTGSSRGLGTALARALMSAGAHVVVHGRDEATARQTAQQLVDQTGGAADVELFDVTDASAVDAGVRAICDRHGRIDVLVNNAGIQRRAPITEFTDDDWQELLASNLTSVFNLSRRVGREMIASGRGKIINIASVQSKLARPGIAPYSATKGGIVMLTKGLCADLAPHGVQVNAIAPGYFATELTAPLVADETFNAWITGRTPAGRWGDPDDLGGPVVFLASQASDFVNGQTIFVDGGMTAVV